MSDILQVLRQYKIGPFAIFDTVTAYLGIFLIAPLLTKLFSKMHIIVPRSAWLWFTLPIAVLFHLIFGQNTPFMKFLFDKNGFYIPAVVLIFMIFMGLRNIKKMRS